MGYPQTLETREDYEYIRKNYPKEIWEKDYLELLIGSYKNIIVGKNPTWNFPDPEDKETVVFNYDLFSTIDDNGALAKRILENPDKWTKVEEINFFYKVVTYHGVRYLVYLMEDRESKLFKLGYDPDTIMAYLFDLEVPDIIENGVEELKEEEVLKALEEEEENGREGSADSGSSEGRGADAGTDD